MGFFERLGLVEREETNDFSDVMATEVSNEEQVSIDVSADINSAVNVIDEIYDQNSLADKSDSIYTVQALINTLPNEMTTAKKQTTVSGILMVSGKSVERLLNDAQNRINTLSVARDEIVNEKSAEIDEATRDIESLKEAIEAATIKIKNATEIIDATDKAVDNAIQRIKNKLKKKFS